MSRSPSRPEPRTRHAFAVAAEAVTPVVGSLLILGITVVGIAAALLWGGPELDRLEERGAQLAMIGEFREVRRDTLVLSLSDSARVPRISMDQGDLNLVEGTRIQIAATFDDLQLGAPDCTIHVTKLGVSGNNDQFAISTTAGCDNFEVSDNDLLTCAASTQCLRIYKVTGSNVNGARGTIVSSSGGDHVVAVSDGSPSVAQDLLASSWLFELGPGGTPPARGAAWVDVWNFRTTALEWSMPGRTGVSVYYEAGAIFATTRGTVSLVDAPPMDEEAYLTQDFVWRMPTMSGQTDGVSGRTVASMFVGLVGADQRTSRDDTQSLRLDFDGRYAEAWCNTLRLRTSDLQYGTYAEDPSFSCSAGDANGVRSIGYTTVDPITAVSTTFPFELFHARITTNL